MERFAVFRAKDPQVTMWLQKNGFQKRRSEALVETRAANTSQISREETQLAAQTKEVRFYADRRIHSKTSTLVSVKKTATEQEGNEVQHHERLSSLEMPAISFSKTKGSVLNQNKKEPSLAENINTDGRKKIRSYSCPPDSRPTLSRRYSTVSLFSDRPCNIPVLIRNNDVRLRKYSCPEYYSAGTNYNKEQKKSSKLHKNPHGKRTALNAANNSHQQSANKLGNQTTREENETKINHTSGLTIKQANTNLAMVWKKELSNFSIIPATDHNGNELFKPTPNSTPDDDGFGLVFHEESLESYSSEILPKQPTKQNVPSSMYNSRGYMLAWLGEVNKNIYPQIRS